MHDLQNQHIITLSQPFANTWVRPPGFSGIHVAHLSFLCWFVSCVLFGFILCLVFCLASSCVLCFLCLHPVSCALFGFILCLVLCLASSCVLCFVWLHPVSCLASSCVLCFAWLHPVSCVLFGFILCLVFCLASSCGLCAQCCQILWSVHSLLPIRVSLTLIINIINMKPNKTQDTG